MKKSIGPKTIVFPNPVFLIGTYDAQGRANIMTVAWAGICCSQPPCIAVSLRKATYSYGNLTARRAFTVSIPPVGLVKETDHVGIYSGRDEDKFAATGLTPVHSEMVDAPYVSECPLVLECRLLHTFELGLHTQFVGEILDVKAEEETLTSGGAPDIEKISPLIYAAGVQAYYGVGQRVAGAFSVGRTGPG